MKKIFCILMILALAFCFAACGTANDSNAESEDSIVSGGTIDNPVELGEGANTFMLETVMGGGEEFFYIIKTDEETVGDALYSLGMVDGEQGQYGLYIKYVNDEFHDYETDGTYWAFYVDGEYAELSCDATPVDPDKLFTLKVETME